MKQAIMDFLDATEGYVTEAEFKALRDELVAKVDAHVGADRRCKTCAWCADDGNYVGCFVDPPTVDGRPMTQPDYFCSKWECE
jgi:hypothetical protein